MVVEAVEMLQHRAANCTLNFVEADVESGEFMVVFVPAPVIAQHADLFSEGVVVRRQATAVAEHREIFRREK